MLVVSCRYAQYVAVVGKMDVACVTTQQTVYYPVHIPLSVSISGIKSLLHLRSLAHASRLNNFALGSGVWIYTYPDVKHSISEPRALLQVPGRTGGFPV
jgi:hypothetical protein